jgi:hypothetical protein
MGRHDRGQSLPQPRFGVGKSGLMLGEVATRSADAHVAAGIDFRAQRQKTTRPPSASIAGASWFAVRPS